jgi:hypothetical protein
MDTLLETIDEIKQTMPDASYMKLMASLGKVNDIVSKASAKKKGNWAVLRTIRHLNNCECDYAISHVGEFTYNITMKFSIHAPHTTIDSSIRCDDMREYLESIRDSTDFIVYFKKPEDTHKIDMMMINYANVVNARGPHETHIEFCFDEGDYTLKLSDLKELGDALKKGFINHLFENIHDIW